MMKPIVKKREQWVDCWKGLLILLVVAGHVVGGGVHLAQEPVRDFFSQAYQVIYSFHMPAFFVVAGMLCAKEKVAFPLFLKKKFFRLLIPYFCVGIFSSITYCIFQGQFFQAIDGQVTTSYYSSVRSVDWFQPLLSLFHAGGWPGGEGFRMNGVLWFLPCLFSTQVFFWLAKDPMRRSLVVRWLILSMCLVLAFLLRRLGWLSLPWGLSFVPYYMLFMALGFFGLPRILHVWSQIERCGHGLMILITGSMAFVAVVMLLPDLSNAFQQVTWYFVYLAAALVGVILSVFWAHVLSKKIGSSFWVMMGGQSLGIMLFHKYAILAFQLKISAGRALFTQDLWHAVLGGALVIGLSVVFSLLVAKVLMRCMPWVLGIPSKRIQNV